MAHERAIEAASDVVNGVLNDDCVQDFIVRRALVAFLRIAEPSVLMASKFSRETANAVIQTLADELEQPEK